MKVYLRTFGCRANQYDTETVRALMRGAGIEEVLDPTDADMAVFNSCTVTAAAEADLRAEVRLAKRVNPGLRSIVMGCAAGLPGRDESMRPVSTLPGVEAVVAGADITALAAALGVNSLPASSGAIQTGARALLRIQDGCDEHCTFCATTLARGANRSRSVDAIVEEATALAESHPEIVLTGIHIGTYGRDIGESLAGLVGTLIARVPIVRFRLSSVEATEVDDDLAELLIADHSRLAPHLHAPLQSGSDAILRRMGRHWYTSASYEAAAMRVTSGSDRFALSADVITGFPGETNADHELTVAMVERLPFTSLHVFPYSARPGTASLRLGHEVASSVSRSRARQLRDIAARKQTAYAASRSGGDCDVVITERGKGLTEDYLSVSVSDSSLPRRERFRARLMVCNDELTAVPLPSSKS
ncbi:MAG: MiaB/RimO family radical SAM methylthiotransferase [Gemmatimonadaceae bacterium]